MEQKQSFTPIGQLLRYIMRDGKEKPKGLRSSSHEAWWWQFSAAGVVGVGANRRRAGALHTEEPGVQ